MTPNLTLSHTHAAKPLEVQYLSAEDIPQALELIATIKSSGCLDQPHHLKPRKKAELIELYEEGYPLLGIKNFEGKLVSFATVSKISDDDDALIIRSLCTSPDYEGCGCGKKIIDAALSWAKNNSSAPLKAKVSCDNKSLHLFTKAGFAKSELQWDSQDQYSFYMMSLNNVKTAPSIGLHNAHHPTYQTPKWA